jgi:group I intron endonuclease
MKLSGIYIIINTKTNHFYIGSAVNFQKRWNTHKRLLRKNEHHCQHLQNSWNIDGEKYFEFYVIEYTKDNSTLIELEQKWINKFWNQDVLFNTCQFAYSSKGRIPWNKGKTGVQVAWNKGLHCSKETKKKLSIFNLGKKLSQETKDKISKTSKGKIISEKTKKKISKAKKGHEVSLKTRKKISNTLKCKT